MATSTNIVKTPEPEPEAEAEEYDEYNDTCPECGGQMDWCKSCNMWSMSCCAEYGSCRCS